MRRAIIFLLEQKEPVLLEDEIKRQSQLYPWTVERLAVAERLRGTFVVVVRGQRSHPEVGSFQHFRRTVMLASEGAGPGAFGGVCAFKGRLGKEARQPGCRVTSRPVAVPSSGLDGPPRGVRREAGAALAARGSVGQPAPRRPPAARGGGGGVPREGPGRDRVFGFRKGRRTPTVWTGVGGGPGAKPGRPRASPTERQLAAGLRRLLA